MGLKYIIDEIKAATGQDVVNINAETKRMKAKVVSDASDYAKQVIEESRKQGEGAVLREQVQLASAELHAKKTVAEAKNRLIEQVYDETKAGLNGIAKDKRYPSLFKKLCDEAIGELGKDCVIHCNKRDLPLAKKFGKAVADLECAGGIMAFSGDGLVRINNTLEAILEEYEEELRQKAYYALFGAKQAAQQPNAAGKQAPKAAKSRKG